LKNKDFESAKSHINTSYSKANQNEKWLALAKFHSAKEALDSTYYYLFKVDSTDLKLPAKADYYFHLAQSKKRDDEVDIAFQNYEIAKAYYESLGFYKKANEINYHIFTILDAQEHLKYGVEDYLKAYEIQAKRNQWNDQLINLNLQKAAMNFSPQGQDSVEYYLDVARAYNKAQYDLYKAIKIDTYQGVYYAEVLRKTDTAKYFYNKILDKIPKEKTHDYSFYTYLNLASAYRYEGNIAKAIQLLKRSESSKLKAYKKNNYKLLYELLASDYESLGKLDSALYYMKKHIAYRDSLNLDKQNINLIKYQAERKEKQNLLLATEVDKKQRQKTNVIYGSSLLLVSSIVVGLLVYKNTKRKELIAIQEKELENKRIEKILNEQELSTIDAMITGQEKERQRIASDLHDNIGATLSAAKLHFDYPLKE